LVREQSRKNKDETDYIRLVISISDKWHSRGQRFDPAYLRQEIKPSRVCEGFSYVNLSLIAEKISANKGQHTQNDIDKN